MDAQFHKILDLVRKTGDRFIFTDPQSGNAFVVMDLDQYQSLVQGESKAARRHKQTFTEEDFDIQDVGDDEAPPDIEEEAPEAELPPEIWNVMAESDTQGEERKTWDISKLTPQERQELERQFARYHQQKNARRESSNRIARAAAAAKAAERERSPEKVREEFSEEQFYLEPID